MSERVASACTPPSEPLPIPRSMTRRLSALIEARGFGHAPLALYPYRSLEQRTRVCHRWSSWVREWTTHHKFVFQFVEEYLLFKAARLVREDDEAVF